MPGLFNCSIVITCSIILMLPPGWCCLFQPQAGAGSSREQSSPNMSELLSQKRRFSAKYSRFVYRSRCPSCSPAHGSRRMSLRLSPSGSAGRQSICDTSCLFASAGGR